MPGAPMRRCRYFYREGESPKLIVPDGFCQARLDVSGNGVDGNAIIENLE